MSVEVVIKNRQLFKKPLSINNLTLGKYSYGHFDDYYRRVDGLIEGFNVLYNPNKIGRGIQFQWSNFLRNEISLSVNFAGTKYDIEMFHEVIRNIMHVWKAKTFERDGVVYKEADIDAWCNSDKDCNWAFLAQQEENMTIFGAAFPIDIDFKNEEITKLIVNQDEEGYANYLHKLQSSGAYFAVPIIYSLNENEYYGNYVASADTDTIFPKAPGNPIMFINPKTGKQLECSLFTVTLVSLEKKCAVGRMSFEDFANKVNIKGCPAFDHSHVFLKGMSEKEIQDLADSEHVDPLGQYFNF